MQRPRFPHITLVEGAVLQGHLVFMLHRRLVRTDHPEGEDFTEVLQAGLQDLRITHSEAPRVYPIMGQAALAFAYDPLSHRYSEEPAAPLSQHLRPKKR